MSMIGIIGYGGYVPRLRLSREVVTRANAWFAPHLSGKGRGARAMANWDEDSVTMAVAAARDCLGPSEDRSHVRAVYLASNTLPFADRINSGIIAEALTLDDDVDTLDVTASARIGLSAILQGFARTETAGGHTLVVAADHRKTRPASAAELDYGDGAAALLLGAGDCVAELLGSGTLSVDFVDHFRAAGEDIDYAWEERWIRDEGVIKLVPQAIQRALTAAQLTADHIDTFIFPTTFAKLDGQVAKTSGIRPEALTDTLASNVGDTGVAHPLLLLAHVLERAKPGQIILVAQFGSGAQALIFRVTQHIETFKPVTGVSGYIERGVAETSYTKFLSFGGQIALEKGMRGEQDKKTALTTLYRHRRAILGLVGGRCRETGRVHFPPSRVSLEPGKPLQDTQEPYKLAERPATVLSWSAEYLSYHPAPPHYYGQVDFEGGGRILMDFTDISQGDVAAGTPVTTVFRIKDVDERRKFVRYFWKVTPLRRAQSDAAKG